jgi:2,4-dienoyl-CoA reductase-like NADH-dependent reductase (Old Yellow Enzyme family)
MKRSEYAIFSSGTIAGIKLNNRLVRSSTWDPCLFHSQEMTHEVLDLYRDVSLGGAGLIISGGLPVYRERFPDEEADKPYRGYHELMIKGLEQMPATVHQARQDARIIAQLEVGYLDAGPSPIVNPFTHQQVRPLSLEEIKRIIGCFVEGIQHMQACGFDGVQLHAAHGGLLSRFLSPYSNQRMDDYGGSPKNQVRIVAEIITRARKQVGDFPIVIKMNGTDHLPDGIQIGNFPELAAEVAACGVDAIEISGGMWDCLLRPVEELDFRPVPAPESHTRIHKPEQQSYYRKYAEALDLKIPIILVGGNRNIESLEAIIRHGKVDFISLCRPLIREPGLPNRWREGRGSALSECVSCNSCIYDMFVHPGRPEPGLVTCICKSDKDIHRKAQKWLATWRENELAH